MMFRRGAALMLGTILALTVACATGPDLPGGGEPAARSGEATAAATVGSRQATEPTAAATQTIAGTQPAGPTELANAETRPDDQPATVPTPSAPAPTRTPAEPTPAGDAGQALDFLTDEERDCLPEEVASGEVEVSISNVTSRWEADRMNEVVQCLSDESIVRLTVLPGMNSEATLTGEEEDCIAKSALGGMIRLATPHGDDFLLLDALLFSVAAHLTLTAETCMAPERFQMMRLPATETDRLKCITAGPDEAEKLLDLTLAQGRTAVDERIGEAGPCLLKFPPDPLIEPIPNCTDEQRQQGLPCRID